MFLRSPDNCPIVPLGHKNGMYFFISASGELRSIKAEVLESGRAVRALFDGVSTEAGLWCCVALKKSRGEVD